MIVLAIHLATDFTLHSAIVNHTYSHHCCRDEDDMTGGDSASSIDRYCSATRSSPVFGKAWHEHEAPFDSLPLVSGARPARRPSDFSCAFSGVRAASSRGRRERRHTGRLGGIG